MQTQRIRTRKGEAVNAEELERRLSKAEAQRQLIPLFILLAMIIGFMLLQEVVAIKKIQTLEKRVTELERTK